MSFNYIHGREHHAVDAITDALLMRAGIKVATPHPAAADFRGVTMGELARAGLRHAGISEAELEKLHGDRAIGRSIELARNEGARSLPGMGTSDLPSVIANVAQKALIAGWQDEATTYQSIARVIPVDDFRRMTLVGLSEAPLLEQVGEHGEIPAGLVTDVEEYVTAKAHGVRVGISRQLLTNNDMAAALAGPLNAGRAAARTVNAAVYAALISNSGVGPTLNQDSLALFHSTHANYDATSGGITVANVSVGRQRMRRQADPTTERRLNIPAAVLLVPPALESEARVVAGADHIPGDANNLQVVVEAALEDGTNGATAWYLAADPQRFDGLVIGAIDGQLEPMLASKPGWNMDGFETKVVLDFGVAAVGYKSWYRKRGA